MPSSFAAAEPTFGGGATPRRAQGRSRPGRLLRGLGGRLHLTATLLLLFSLFAPVATLQSLTASAAPAVPEPAMNGVFQGGGDDPPPFPAPSQASLEGSFQTLLGCPADFDASCGQTQLS
jgi:hypothetical protein